MSNILTYKLFENKLNLKDINFIFTVETQTDEEYLELMKILHYNGFVWSDSDPIMKSNRLTYNGFGDGYRFITMHPKSIYNSTVKNVITHGTGHVAKNNIVMQFKNLFSINFKELIDNKEKEMDKMRMKHSDIDPYGEEDWIDESKLFEFNLFKKRGFNLKKLKTNISVELNTLEEYKTLMGILDDAGYIWNDDTLINNHKKDWKDWFSNYGYRFILIMPNEKKIGHMTSCQNYIQLKDLISSEYMKNREKEIEKEKMKHIDIDPFDEEDW